MDMYLIDLEEKKDNPEYKHRDCKLELKILKSIYSFN